jgi:hypothetical protein
MRNSAPCMMTLCGNGCPTRRGKIGSPQAFPKRSSRGPCPGGTPEALPSPLLIRRSRRPRRRAAGGSGGKREEARKLLAPVYNWFTEGFDMVDLQEAKALLEGVGISM